MSAKFKADFKTLRKVVALTGILGEWRRRENHRQYRAWNGSVLNWWKSTGTVTFQGPKIPAKALEKAFSKVVSGDGIRKAISK
jgi:hypothetical protein